MTEGLPFLFESVVPDAACQRCFDAGIWLTPRNIVTTCPNLVSGKTHNAPNQAALILQNAFQSKQNWVKSFAFDLARILTNYTQDKPCSTFLLLSLFFKDTNLTDDEKEKKFDGFVDELRSVWSIPVEVTKQGCWINTEAEVLK